MDQDNNPYQPPNSELESYAVDIDIRSHRKRLVPLWIKVFGWLFIVFGAFVPFVGIYAAITGVDSSFSLYGLETAGTVYSPLAIFIMLLFFAHAVCAYGLLFARSWGVDACIWLGYISVVICIVTMVASMVSYNSLNIRLELAVLIPYLIKLHKIRPQWSVKNINPAGQSKMAPESPAG